MLLVWCASEAAQHLLKSSPTDEFQICLTWKIGEGDKQQQVEQQDPAYSDGKGYPHPHPLVSEVVEVQNSCA